MRSQDFKFPDFQFFFNSDIFSRVLTFSLQVLLLISINIMVPYKSDFTKNNYDLFIKGPAFYYLEMILSAFPSSVFSLDLCRTSGTWRTIFLWTEFPEFLWVIKFSCIELSSSLIFISLVFFNFDFPNKWRIRSNAYATKILFSERPIQIFQKIQQMQIMRNHFQ